ncbi:MAG: OmpA family protein [Verrucomicrobiota bacterium]|jgi:peptidoglycan-associated lipoprotein
MKAIQFSELLVLSLILTVAATGCKKTPVKVTDMNGPRMGYNSAPSDNITNLTGAEPLKPGAEVEANARPREGIPSVGPDRFRNYLPHPEILKAYSVYFDFDSSVIKSGEKPKINSVAEYLKGHPGEAVRIEGNCDERGTEEYNRSLGERRALASREALVEQGADSLMLETTSYGKDKPVALGHDESAWRLNRRCDFVVLTPPAAP